MDSPFAGLRMTKLITCKALVLLLLICIVSLTDSTPSFGFDSANSCSPNGKMSRRGRAQMLAAIPCDLAKQPFCHLPGSIYPWHAVRRFVHENQGLMKRMYGDVRHISILRDEIQNNEVVDSDDIEEAAERYSKTPRGAKFMLHERDEFSNFKGNDVLMEPHFRPMSTTTSTTSSTTTTTTTTTPTPERSTTSTASTSSASWSSSTTTTVAPPAVAVAQPERESEQEQVELDVANSVYEVLPGTTASTSGSTTATRASVGDNIQIIESPELGSLPASPGTLRNLTIANVAKPTAAPATKRPTTTMPVRKQRPKEAATPPTPAKLSTNGTTMSGAISGASSTTIALLPRRNVTKSTLGSTTPVSFASLFSSTYTALGADKLRRPLLSHSTTTTTTTSTTTSTTPVPVSTTTKPGLLREGGQLFQDAMKQEPMTVTSNMRGVNACPVKDEVVAPFWANNTRGEVLALLNLYPFEQYVHWEKCTHEFKQMFCRDGCRCEQQYRLHRLLAYDPHNECRGIFSDWFRFPSSCICKCYNIPMDFRATSRSPRSESGFDAPQSPAQSPPPPASLVSDPIGAAEAVVQRAIYEHATDQWYRPRDEYDFFEG